MEELVEEKSNQMTFGVYKDYDLYTIKLFWNKIVGHAHKFFESNQIKPNQTIAKQVKGKSIEMFCT